MPAYYHGDTIVEQLNVIAQGKDPASGAMHVAQLLLEHLFRNTMRVSAGVASAAGVPYLDLYHHITAYCGANYSSW